MQKRYLEAEPFLQRSYAAMKAVHGEHGPSTLDSEQRLVTLYQSWGKPEKAAQYKAATDQSASAK